MRSQSQDDPNQAIAARIRIERDTRGWSLADLAERSGVSKAMISKIERGDASPTATVLGRLSGAFGLSLSVLLALAERSEDRISRHGHQPVWQDPETGYVRRTISPPSGDILELLQITLPPGVRVPYPAAAFLFQRQQIWVLQGELEFREGGVTHSLEQGDCLQLGPPADSSFFNPGASESVYLVALVRR